MIPSSNYSDRPLRAKLRELGLLSREQEAGLPQFLLLATEHDGARRLAQLLQRLPGFALPDGLETRFFSSRHESRDLDWYIRVLGGIAHLVRGEWTPSYALLPVKTIRLIHELLPQLKLVFLLRDPAVEAWHAWQESRQNGQLTGALSETWPWARADLLGQLHRWKSAFPADQFFIAFEEQLHSEQETCLKGLCEFLGVEFAPSELHKGLLADSHALPPVLEVSLLREACRLRIEELVACLAHDFGRNAPAHWIAAPSQIPDSEQVAQLTRTFSAVVEHEFDDVYLYGAVRSDEASSRSPSRSPTAPIYPLRNTGSPLPIFTPEKLTAYGDSPPQLVKESYRGFNVVAFRHEFIAIPQAAGKVDLPHMSYAALDEKVNAREFLRARSLLHAERLVDEFLAPGADAA